MYYLETLTSTGAGVVDLSTLDPDLNKILNVPKDVIRTIKALGTFGADADLNAVRLWKGNELVSKSGINHENITATHRETMLNVNVSYNDEKIPLELDKAGDVTFTLCLVYTDEPKRSSVSRGYRGARAIRRG